MRRPFDSLLPSQVDDQPDYWRWRRLGTCTVAVIYFGWDGVDVTSGVERDDHGGPQVASCDGISRGTTGLLEATHIYLIQTWQHGLDNI
jgi:hypothetical protein